MFHRHWKMMKHNVRVWNSRPQGKILSVFITADPTVNNEETCHKSRLRHRYEGNPCRSFVEEPSWENLTLPSRKSLGTFLWIIRKEIRVQLVKKKTRQYSVYLATNDLSTSGQSDYQDQNIHLTCCWPSILLRSYDLHNLHSNCSFQLIYPFSLSLFSKWTCSWEGLHYLFMNDYRSLNSPFWKFRHVSLYKSCLNSIQCDIIHLHFLPLEYISR